MKKLLFISLLLLSVGSYAQSIQLDENDKPILVMAAIPEKKVTITQQQLQVKHRLLASDTTRVGKEYREALRKLRECANVCRDVNWD